MADLKFRRSKPDNESGSRLTTILTVFTNRKLSILWRLLISGILVYILVTRIDMAELLASFKNMKLSLVFGAIGLVYFCNLILAYKWRVILQFLNVNTGYLRLVKFYFIGTFFRYFLPGGFGSDLVRGYSMFKDRQKKTPVIASLVMERITSFAAGLILAGAAWALLFSLIRSTVGGFELLIIALAFLAAIALGYYFRNSLISLFLGKILKTPRVRKLTQETIEEIFSLLTMPKRLILLLTISVVYHLLTTILCYLVGLALGIDVPFFYYMVFIPIISVVIRLPISLYGIGVREGIFVIFFGHVGLSAEKAVSISLLVFTIGVLSSLVGGVLYMLPDFRTA